MKLSDIPWTVRALNVFASSGINSIDDLTKKSVTDLIKIRNCGKNTIREIENRLQEHGLFLYGQPVYRPINRQEILAQLDRIKQLFQSVETALYLKIK
jgi:DNA-directed RNA polymerase alpha subunit